MIKRLNLFLLILLISFTFISAQVNPLEGVPGGDAISGLADGENPADKIENFKDKLVQKKENQDFDYLRQEWGKILKNNTYLGPIVVAYDNVHPYLNPVFKYTVGIELTLSWLFLLAFFIWITILVYLHEILELFSMFSGTTSFVISLCLSIIVGAFFKWPKSFAEFLIGLITGSTSPWIQIGMVVLIIIALVILAVYSKELGKYIEGLKERRAKQAAVIDRWKLKKSRENAEDYSKKVNEALGK
jgi:hypothetical protein